MSEEYLLMVGKHWQDQSYSDQDCPGTQLGAEAWSQGTTAARQDVSSGKVEQTNGRFPFLVIGLRQ